MVDPAAKLAVEFREECAHDEPPLVDDGGERRVHIPPYRCARSPTMCASPQAGVPVLHSAVPASVRAGTLNARGGATSSSAGSTSARPSRVTRRGSGVAMFSHVRQLQRLRQVQLQGVDDRQWTPIEDPVCPPAARLAEPQWADPWAPLSFCRTWTDSIALATASQTAPTIPRPAASSRLAFGRPSSSSAVLPRAAMRPRGCYCGRVWRSGCLPSAHVCTLDEWTVLGEASCRRSLPVLPAGGRGGARDRRPWAEGVEHRLCRAPPRPADGQHQPHDSSNTRLNTCLAGGSARRHTAS